MKRWTTVLDVHYYFAVAVSTVLTEPFDSSFLVEAVRSDVLKGMAKAVIATAVKTFINPIEESNQLVLGRRQRTFCPDTFRSVQFVTYRFSPLLFGFARHRIKLSQPATFR